jgi:uncharacterized protein (DUF697 family)
LVSGGAAAIPLPGTDVGVDVLILVEMLPAISRRFGLSKEQIDHLNPLIKQRILILATSFGSELIGKFVTKELVVQLLKRIGIRVTTKSVAKFIPVLGQALAATISFGAMKLIGNAHIDDCYKVAKELMEKE